MSHGTITVCGRRRGGGVWLLLSIKLMLLYKTDFKYANLIQSHGIIQDGCTAMTIKIMTFSCLKSHCLKERPYIEKCRAYSL